MRRSETGSFYSLTPFSTSVAKASYFAAPTSFMMSMCLISFELMVCKSATLILLALGKFFCCASSRRYLLA